MEGKVDRYFPDRGFGFVRARGRVGRFFFNIRKCSPRLRARLARVDRFEDEVRVTFTPMITPKGPAAADVSEA